MAANRAQQTSHMAPAPTWHAPKSQTLQWSNVLKLADKLASSLQLALKAYLDIDVNAKLMSASPEPLYFWEIQDYYVGQKPLSGTQTIRLRFSTSFCEHALVQALGAPSLPTSSFTLSQLQPFEIYLLEQFSRHVFERLDPVTPFPKGYDVDGGHGEQVYFQWAVTFSNQDEQEPHYIVISYPYDLIYALTQEPEAAEASTNTDSVMTDDFLLTCYGSGMTFRLGSSRIRIQDLDELSYEDMVVLENSRLNAWYLWDENSQYWVTIPVRLPIESEIPQYDSPQGDPNPMKHVSPQSLSWENLQVDLVATFQPMKFPIKRLKEISEGLVLEVTGLMENQITLCVDGQPVAWGELVVVGDKFAVRVQGLYKPDPSLGRQEDERQYRTALPEGVQQAGDSNQGSSGGDIDLLKELDLNANDFNDGDDDWS